MEDSRNKPMTYGDWMKTILLMMIPIVQIILPFVWAFGSNVNTSKKNYFKAVLTFSLIFLILYIIAGVLISIFLPSILNNITDLIKQNSNLNNLQY